MFICICIYSVCVCCKVYICIHIFTCIFMYIHDISGVNLSLLLGSKAKKAVENGRVREVVGNRRTTQV